jgi:hypothetical protein
MVPVGAFDDGGGGVTFQPHAPQYVSPSAHVFPQLGQMVESIKSRCSKSCAKWVGGRWEEVGGTTAPIAGGE